MKYKIHLPTEQYGFIEAETEDRDEAMTEYRRIKKILNGKQSVGLDDKTWRSVLDRYLKDGKMEADKYSEMNTDQVLVIQEIKKSIKRQK